MEENLLREDLDLSGIVRDLHNIDCPYGRAIEVIGNKNTLLIIKELYLNMKPYRFNEILNQLIPMSSKTLSNKLKHLEAYGLVNRNIVSHRPVRIEYSLTKKGLDLKYMLDDLARWSRKWFPKVE